MTTTKDVVLLQ